MALYKQTILTYEAMQWTGDLPATRSWVGSGWPATGGELHLQVPMGIQTAQPNDWLVKDTDKQQLMILPPDYFSTHYELA